MDKKTFKSANGGKKDDPPAPVDYNSPEVQAQLQEAARVRLATLMPFQPIEGTQISFNTPEGAKHISLMGLTKREWLVGMGFSGIMRGYQPGVVFSENEMHTMARTLVNAAEAICQEMAKAHHFAMQDLKDKIRREAETANENQNA